VSVLRSFLVVLVTLVGFGVGGLATQLIIGVGTAAVAGVTGMASIPVLGETVVGVASIAGGLITAYTSGSWVAG